MAIVPCWVSLVSKPPSLSLSSLVTQEGCWTWERWLQLQQSECRRGYMANTPSRYPRDSMEIQVRGNLPENERPGGNADWDPCWVR